MDEVQLLEGLLKIYSPSDQEQEAVEYLVGQMQTLGYTTEIDGAGNAIGTIGEGPLEIVLLGHIDTVPGFINVRREGDALHGRGAVDAKGPLACFTAAAALAGNVPGRRFTVIGAVGEEGDSRGADYIIDRYNPAFTIIGEPSGWEKITLGYKGSARFDYRIQRTLVHTSLKSESACEAAVNFWNRVASWATNYNEKRDRLFEQVTPTLRRIASDSDGFTESASLTLGARLPLDLKARELHEKFAALAADGELKLLNSVEAYRAEKNTPLVRAFLSAIRKEGGTPSFTLKSGTSDMNLVAPAWKTPILAYGPGDSSLDHTPEEHILISEYQRAIRILSEVLIKLNI